MKKIISIISIFAMIMSMCTVSFADESDEYEQKGDFLYYPNTNQIYLYVGESRDIVIPENTDITKMQSGRLKSYDSITISNNVIFDKMPVRADKLILSDGITEIPKSTFYGANAKEVVFPETLKSIGDEAFARSAISGDIVLPDSLESIGAEAFNDTKITSVTMGDNVTSLGDRAFANCFDLQELHLSDKLTKLGQFICEGASLKKVNIPRSLDLTSENHGSFGSKNQDKCEVELNRDMTLELFDFVRGFSGWEKYCKSDKLKNYKDGDAWYVIDDVLVGYAGNSTKPTIPDFIREIHFQAFAQLPPATMETIIIPPSVKKIDEYAFTANYIDYLVVPETVEEIGEGFLSNTYVKELTIEGTPKIDPKALDGCICLLKSKIHVNPNCKLPDGFYSDDLPETEWWTTEDGIPSIATTAPKPTSTEEPTETTEKPSSTVTPVEPTTTEVPKKLTVKSGDELTVKVNGEDVTFPDAKPFVDENGRTQVPIRAVSEMLDCKVDWDDTTKTAVITKDNGDVVKVTLGSDVLLMNDKTTKMDTTAIIKEERTFIPVRFVAEAMGLEVEWVE